MMLHTLSTEFLSAHALSPIFKNTLYSLGSIIFGSRRIAHAVPNDSISSLPATIEIAILALDILLIFLTIITSVLARSLLLNPLLIGMRTTFSTTSSYSLHTAVRQSIRLQISGAPIEPELSNI